MGNCLFLRAREWGIDRQVRKKLQIPGGMPGGGMVTGRIEPCIIHTNRDSVRKAREAHLIDKAKALEPQGLNRRDELHL